MTQHSAAEILARSKVIAMVGASNKPDKPSHGVMRYLQGQGFRVIPVNPGLAGQTLLGETVHARLADIPAPVDLVDVFRQAHLTPPIVDEAIAIGAKAVWLQLGIVSAEAEAKAEAAGIDFIQDMCTAVVAGRHEIRH